MDSRAPAGADVANLEPEVGRASRRKRRAGARPPPETAAAEVAPEQPLAGWTSADPLEAPTTMADPRRERFRFLRDRTLVLFMGLGAGLAIGTSFNRGAATFAPPAAASLAHASAPRAAAPSPAAADCAIPFPPRLLAKVAAGKPISVGVFGDSFGDGVWAALYHRLGRDRFTVLRLSQEGTGFTRYRVANLEEQASGQLSRQPLDLAVIVTGANDTEGIADGKHVYPLLSPGWKTVYGGRMDRFVSLIRNQGAMVYWVGLPKMRSPSYDQDVNGLNQFYSERMAALGVPFLPTREISADHNGDFNLYLPKPGTAELKPMRAGDGIHMTMAGYELLAGPLIDRINHYVAQAHAFAVANAGAGAGAPDHASSGSARPS